MTSASQLTSGGTMRPEEKEVSDASHIYIITKMPDIFFSKESFKYEDGVLSGHIYYNKQGNRNEIPFEFELPLLDGAAKVELSPFPHREYRTYNETGEIVRYLQANTICIATGMHLEIPELHNLEVLYVGQSFGDGSRTAFERLQSHSTLQKILATEQHNDPESEVFVLTVEYADYQVITSMTGHADIESEPRNENDRFFSILSNPLDLKQQISLVEAGLIRYFQPKYNEIYKDSFPSSSHKILSGCYKLDFSGLIVEIDTDELRFKLYSNAVHPAYHHISKYDLVSHENRWSFFHFTDREGEARRLPGVVECN